MFTAIYYSFLIVFTLPAFAQELTLSSADHKFDFSEKQWELLRDFICSGPSILTSLEWETQFDEIFPELSEPQSTQDLWAQELTTKSTSSKKKRDPRRTCPLCGKVVSKISVHLRYHENEYNYPCDQCPRMFKEACNLSRHKKTHEAKLPRENESPLATIAAGVKDLKRTKPRATPQKVTKRKAPDEKEEEGFDTSLNPEFKASELAPTGAAFPILAKLSLEEEQAPDSSAKRFARSLEQMAQNTPGGAKILRNHIRLESKIKKYTPTGPSTQTAGPTQAQSMACMRAVLNNGRDAEHHETKKSKKKFRCTLCEKKYERIGHLNKHLQSHYRAPKKPIVAHIEGLVCAKCSKVFKYDRDYQDHMNIHTGQKPHVCTSCNKGFAARSNLKDHMRHYCSAQT